MHQVQVTTVMDGEMISRDCGTARRRLKDKCLASNIETEIDGLQGRSGKTAAKPLIAGSRIPSVALVPPSLFYPPAHFLCVRHGGCRLPNTKEDPRVGAYSSIHPFLPVSTDSGRRRELEPFLRPFLPQSFLHVTHCAV